MTGVRTREEAHMPYTRRSRYGLIMMHWVSRSTLRVEGRREQSASCERLEA